MTAARLSSLCVALAFVMALPGSVLAQPQSAWAVSHELANDGKYVVDNSQLDLEDIVTSPAHVADPGSPFRSPRFYLALAGAGALWGGSFALDQTMRSHLRGMSRSAHDVMENFSYATLISGLGLLYIDGLYTHNQKLRHYLLTGTEAAGMGVLFNLGIKAAFGRLRPSQTSSHLEFFHAPRSFNSRSFTSNDMVIETAMATGISEYFDNRWYVAAPVYSLVALEGVTRMKNQQWFSDVVAGGMLGWGMAELLLYLHKKHAREPDRWRIISVAPPAPAGGTGAVASLGAGLEYSW